MILSFSKLFAPIAKKSKSLSGFALRSFDCAKIDRLLAPWSFDGGFGNDEIRKDLVAMRSRSNDMFKNSAHMRRYVYLSVINIVGEGFNFKSMPHDGNPGSSNYRLDTGAAKFIEYHYSRWAKNPKWVDETGRKTLCEIDKMNVKSWKRDGEAFMIINRFAQNPYGISLRVIRAEAIDHNYNMILSNGHVVRMGIELDNSMRPVAVYVSTTKEYQTHIGFSGLPLARISHEDIIHIYTQETEDQVRGVPAGHSIMSKLKMLNEFDKAELACARDEANTCRTYHAPANQADEIVDLTDPLNRETADRMLLPSEPGQKEILPFGWQSEVKTPQHPNREITNFKRAMLRDVATGVNLEYANFANDWSGVNYSSVRAGTISERDCWKIDQDTYINQCKSPVFLAWLWSFLNLSISGQYPIEKYDKFAEHRFKGRRWDWVDPARDMKAAETAVSHGWKTDSQIAAELNNDFDANVEEIRRTDAIKKGTSLEVKKDEKEKQPAQ